MVELEEYRFYFHDRNLIMGDLLNPIPTSSSRWLDPFPLVVGEAAVVGVGFFKFGYLTGGRLTICSTTMELVELASQA